MKNWIQKATRSIKRRGTEEKCTPISKPGCTGRAKALALTFKKMAKKENGGELDPPNNRSTSPIAIRRREAVAAYDAKVNEFKKTAEINRQARLARRANNEAAFKQKLAGAEKAAKARKADTTIRFTDNAGNKIVVSSPGKTTMAEKINILTSIKKQMPTPAVNNANMIRNRSDARMNSINRLENGGAASTGQAIGSAVGSMANMIVPGLGSILSPVLGMVGGTIGGGIDKRNAVQDNISKMTVNTNPYGMELGGMIQGRNDDLSFYKGRSHRDGGILVNQSGMPSYNPVAEVEGGETRWKVGKKGYIFSKKLKI